MQPRDFLSRARVELAKRGVFGLRAAGLLEDWNDHLETEIENLVASGEQHDKAVVQACKDISPPLVYAPTAGPSPTAKCSCRNRHPMFDCKPRPAQSGNLTTLTQITG